MKKKVVEFYKFTKNFNENKKKGIYQTFYQLVKKIRLIKLLKHVIKT